MKRDKQGRDSVILAGARLPQGKFLGGLAAMSAAELGQLAVKAAIERSGIQSQDIDEVMIGNVVSAGVGQALPRQISIRAGIPDRVGGTVHIVGQPGFPVVLTSLRDDAGGAGKFRFHQLGNKH